MALADTIMANVRTRLRNLGIQDQEFASRVGVTPQMMSRWLNRKSNFKIRHVDKMAEVLGCQPEDLARDPSDSVIPLMARDVDALIVELARVRGYSLVRAKKS
jgi:transcriptional regulator with XRE-family HTH domain